MVSLGEESRRSGGFSDLSESGQGDSQELLAADGLSNEASVRRLPTPWIIVTFALLVVGQDVAVFLVPLYSGLGCQSNGRETSAASIIAYSQTLLWFLCLLFDRYCQYHHYVSRTAGYLEFYRRTRNVRRLPLVIVSGVTATMLLMLALLTDYCPTGACEDFVLTCCNFQQILVSAQMVVLLVVLIIYMVHTCKFNRGKALPDVCQEDYVVNLCQPQLMSMNVGYRDESFLDEVLEKQADMISYLRQHNVNLAKRLIDLSSQLRQQKGCSA